MNDRASVFCLGTHTHPQLLSQCVLFPSIFSFSTPPPHQPTSRPPCRHNPSVYEITRAHLCSGGSHLGSEEASAGNHLGSMRRSPQPTSPVLLPRVLTAAIYFQGSRDSDLAEGKTSAGSFRPIGFKGNGVGCDLSCSSFIHFLSRFQD